ncbi:hypothetical protein [Apilactobacillus ozensis]|uniref:Lipoprotein n=1 Tax=Apilactobacillus ozensis DSM 23829 = JCM 17196 TaxID=1423781 RepID=A0A0R2AZQ6_9LACO|nr:hypothetical protein [Apilactobacillus ozensis]KRM69595.1 hypothetical protein FD06_GL001083 [Apilactobacillus ozensis DSM 23829 = JCM 17196]MCK8607409.1 hypothetical protein [Apilactobacillus ozensis]
MKLYKKLLPAAMLLGVSLTLTACGQNNDNGKSSNASSSTNVSSSSQSSSVSESSQSSSASSSASATMNSKLGDAKVPANDGSKSNGSADTKTHGNKDNFNIDYKNGGQVYATYTKHTYNSNDEAHQQIDNYQTSEDTKGLPTIDLGYNIQGSKDQGAGQIYIHWNMGNWSMSTHGNNVDENSNDAQKEAVKAVKFLQSNTLPAPQNRGVITLDGSDNQVKWQEQNAVYTVKATTADAALRIATSIK